ncbi:hypothetical protein EON65_19075 [archaeon]|nr:MAG: hypothetical protein EON65_19075 [archaeon]
MYDAWEYYQQHGVNISVGVADKNDWYNASVTLYSAPDLDGSTKERINRVINLSADTLQDHDNEGNTAYRGAKYYEGNLVHYRVIPYIYDMPGFSSTKFAKHHDLTKQWETFHPTDCTDPGSF